jgi:hypothetical protein
MDARYDFILLGIPPPPLTNRPPQSIAFDTSNSQTFERSRDQSPDHQQGLNDNGIEKSLCPRHRFRLRRVFLMSLTGDLDDMSKDPGEVWGHKGELCCLSLSIESNLIFSDSVCVSPTQFPSSLLLPSHPIGTITPSKLTDTLNSQSTLSLSPHSISLYGAGSPSPSTASMTIPGTILWLLTSINPTLFSNGLEYLYAGKGFGTALKFFFDTSEGGEEGGEEGDAKENRIDKLRKDVVFAWRSRLYSDVRIALTGNFSSTNHESATAIFSSHRFILVSRSPYFHSQLLTCSSPSSPPTTPWPSTSPPPIHPRLPPLHPRLHLHRRRKGVRIEECIVAERTALLAERQTELDDILDTHDTLVRWTIDGISVRV